MALSTRKIASFRKKIYSHYGAHKRIFPWRQTRNPYFILVSEVMLQQTQVDRVIPYYQNFIKKFPTLTVLSNASLGEVLRTWSGLGYNRRARYLKEMAKIVAKKYKGKIPQEEKLLLTLPCIGRATAAAVRAFAWNLPSLYLDTNVRSVFLHEFFPRRRKVDDTEIEKLLVLTCDMKNPRDWYYALLDYGAMIKKTHGNPNKRSAHYSPQSVFKGSLRELRGKILKILITKQKISKRDLFYILGDDPRLEKLLKTLEKEAFVKITPTSVSLA